MPLYDYRCNSGHITEKLTVGRDNIPCPICGRLADRIKVYPVSFTFAPTQEKIGTKYNRFQEASAEIDYTCRKFENETNTKVPDLNLWQKAKEQAGV